MSEKKVKSLLHKYIEGRATDHEKELVDRWYDSLSGKGEPVHLSEDKRKALRTHYWNLLAPKLSRPKGRSGKLLPVIIGIAASISVLAILSFLYLVQVDKIIDP